MMTLERPDVRLAAGRGDAVLLAQAQQEVELLDEQLVPGLLLALLGHEAMQRLRAAHTAHNLKPRQFHILGLLHDHGGLAQGELVREMGVAPSILVTLLNPLEAGGLVARERDPADREQLRALLLVMRDGLAADADTACTTGEAGR